MGRFRMILFFGIAMCILLSWSAARAQQFSTAMPVKMDGYIIALDGGIYFQPADSAAGFWNSLDNRSFGIWCDQLYDLYCDAIKGLGKEIAVEYTTQQGSGRYTSTLQYFYATIEIYMHFLSADSNDFKLYKSPYLTFYHDGKTYPMQGFYIRDRILKIIPHNNEYLLRMYYFYVNHGYGAPEWLENLATKIKHSKQPAPLKRQTDKSLSSRQGLLIFESDYDMYFIESKKTNLTSWLSSTKDTVTAYMLYTSSESVKNYREYLNKSVKFDSATVPIHQESYSGIPFEEERILWAKYGSIKYDSTQSYKLQRRYKRIYFKGKTIVLSLEDFVPIEIFTYKANNASSQK